MTDKTDKPDKTAVPAPKAEAAPKTVPPPAHEPEPEPRPTRLRVFRSSGKGYKEWSCIIQLPLPYAEP